MHCSHKTFHFLSVSDGPTSILSDIVISLRKLHEIIFVTYFWKTKNTCERCFWDVSETSRKRHLFWDMSELRRLNYVTQKTLFLRCIWDILKTSQKRHLFWDISERSLRYLSQWRSDWDVSETSHAGWGVSFAFDGFKDNHREKSTLKLNSSVYGKYEYWHLGHWNIKLTIFKRFWNWKNLSKKIE